MMTCSVTTLCSPCHNDVSYKVTSFHSQFDSRNIAHSINVTRFAKRGLIHAQFQDTLFIAIC